MESNEDQDFNIGEVYNSILKYRPGKDDSIVENDCKVIDVCEIWEKIAQEQVENS